MLVTGAVADRPLTVRSRDVGPSPYTGAMPDAATTEPVGTEFLKSVPLFAGLSRRDLASLAKSAHDLTYPAGTDLTSLEGFPATFFVIVQGHVAVQAEGKPRGSLGPGEWFGELALIGGGHRTAVVTAETEVRCLVLTSWTFRAFLKQHPDVSWTLLEVLAQRLSRQ